MPEWSGIDPLLCYRGAAVGAEKLIPEEIDHREIAVSMTMVNKVELLFSPEPRKAAEP